MCLISDFVREYIEKSFNCFGTGQAIKMALLAKGLKEISKFDCRICVTAQHREMLDPVLDLFDTKART